MTFTQMCAEKPDFIRRIASRYIECGSFFLIERDEGLEIGEIEEAFDAYPELGEEFDTNLHLIATNKLQREGSHKVFKIINALFNVISDSSPVEDGGPSNTDRVRAASTLAKFISPPKMRSKEKEGDLDDLFKLLGNDEQ